MKKLHAGGEVDSWCTKCKLVLNHRIIAMLGTKPVRVECSTCSSHHNYRGKAPGEKEPAAAAKVSAGFMGARSTTAAGAKPARAPRGAAATRAAAAELLREQSWEKAIAGKAMSDFTLYRVSRTFSEGDLIRHSKFGDGVVTRVVDVRKVEILFKDESRLLAQGLTD